MNDGGGVAVANPIAFGQLVSADIDRNWSQPRQRAEVDGGGSSASSAPFLHFNEFLTNATKDSGDAIRFECRVDGTTPIRFKWYKNNAPLLKEKGGRVRIKNGEFWSRLRINNLEVLDSGYYQCSARNRAGVVNSTGVLVVRTIFSITYLIIVLLSFALSPVIIPSEKLGQ
ncbi:unnamed protein product [Soboliphyme baturini]|uniref:Ig-like domain-containing protein n=1 Tax=Soboliphyme baturini TaxID=241478 RepID=A0A183IUX2_9BILA|nr:unnamed protein product [Soboliphyme baturini]